MFMIFPAAEVIGALQAEIADYRRRFSNPDLEPGFKGEEVTMAQCARLVYAAADDALNERLLWTPANHGFPRLEEAMSRLLNGNGFTWAGFDDNAGGEHFFIQVMDEVTMQVERWIEHAVPDRSWNIWNMRQLGTDLLLEKGEDYRIVDWTRRMESGEWSDTAFKKIGSTSLHQEDDAIARASLPDIIQQERVTADQLLRFQGLPGIGALNEDTAVVLRMILEGAHPMRKGHPELPPAPKPINRRRARKLPSGAVLVEGCTPTDPKALPTERFHV